MTSTLEERREKQKEVLKLAFELEEFYPQHNFKHHCYLRIAYDNTVHCKWQTAIKRTFLANCNDTQLEIVIGYLKLYKLLEVYMLESNNKSLEYRK